MARRIRNIKPDFFEDETMALLPLEARLFYIGLWTRCDRQGVFEWSLKVITASLFPNDDHIDTPQVIGWLELLVNLDRVRCYEAEGKRWGFVVNFLKHQAISKSEKDKKAPYPPPPIMNRSENGPRDVPGTVTGTIPRTPDLGLPDLGRGTPDKGPRTQDDGLGTTAKRGPKPPASAPFGGAERGEKKIIIENLPERTEAEKLAIVESCRLTEERAKASSQLRVVQ